MTMNLMNPRGLKCKTCKGECDVPMYRQNQNSAPSLSNPGDGPYCRRCYHNLVCPPGSDSVERMKEMRERDKKEGTMIQKKNKPRNPEQVTQSNVRVGEA